MGLALKKIKSNNLAWIQKKVLSLCQQKQKSSYTSFPLVAQLVRALP